MRRVMVLSAGWLIGFAASPGCHAEPPPPGQVVVEFRVRGKGFNGAGFIELYSEAAWDKPGCFFIRIPVGAKKTFEERGISDIASHFLGHVVRARGRVDVLRFGEDTHPVLVVEDPERIERLESGPAYTATGMYRRQEACGFTLLWNPEVDRHPREKDEVAREMARQLEVICAVVPGDRLAVIRRSRIWVEWDATAGAAAHHPSKDWLSASGYNPEKAGDVEIGNARHFVEWSLKTQPWMVMHELAHAYHHATREANGPRIAAAFRAAMKAGLYDSVAHVDGRPPRKAYAANNPQEYFAELTEAYFGRNDFEPFDREGLRKHDPGGHDLMRQVWGEPLR